MLSHDNALISIFNLLYNLAGYSLLKTRPILIMAGIWGLAVFLLENYYTTLLISYVAAPNPQPMIRSIYELRNRLDLRLVTDKNVNLDLILLVISIYKVYKSQNFR